MRIALCIGGAVVLVLAAWAAWPAGVREPPAPAAAASRTVEFEGVASCAAAACHGNGNIGSPGGEWNTWAHLDPHARAYDTLLSDRSRAIQRRLHPEQPDPRPEANAVCLNCHVQPGIMEASRSPRFALADGVGCESCHGPAGKWLLAHTQPGWQRSPASGMVDLRDLRVRAEACTTCHIGAGDVQVNHDLIAAGHPRLRFEFAAYLANLPAHWSTAADRQRHPDSEARAWLIGQGASAAAALRLLAHRANTATNIWPEFAEYDCYACHHDLAAPSWRLTAAPADGKPGRLVLNGWYYDALAAVTKAVDLAPLQQVMGSSYPQRQRVAELAGQQLRKLEAGQASLAKGLVNRGGLLADLAALEQRPGPPSWDRDAQAYLGIAAVTANEDLHPNNRSAAAALRTVLQEAFPAGADGTLASPRGYDPAAVRRAWQELRARLKPAAPEK